MTAPDETARLRARVRELEAELRALRDARLDLWLGLPSPMESLAQCALVAAAGDRAGAIARMRPICPGRPEAEIESAIDAVLARVAP